MRLVDDAFFWGNFVSFLHCFLYLQHGVLGELSGFLLLGKRGGLSI